MTGNLIPAFQRNKRNLVSNYHPIAKFNVFSCEDNGANYFATHLTKNGMLKILSNVVFARGTLHFIYLSKLLMIGLKH